MPARRDQPYCNKLGYTLDRDTRVVAGGRTNGNSVKPALGDNPNVACYMDDLYVYLRARASDAVGRVRPAQEGRQTGSLFAGGEFLHGQ